MQGKDVDGHDVLIILSQKQYFYVTKWDFG